MKKSNTIWKKGDKRLIGNTFAKGMKPNKTSFKKGEHVSIKTEFKKGEMSEKQMGEKNSGWKGGKPNCKLCGKKLDNRKANLCRICYDKNTPPQERPRWKGGGKNFLRNLALVRDNNTCQICGLLDKEVMEVDHIKPKSVYPDLANILENLITLCANCHRRKTSRELRAKLYSIKI